MSPYECIQHRFKRLHIRHAHSQQWFRRLRRCESSHGKLLHCSAAGSDNPRIANENVTSTPPLTPDIAAGGGKPPEPPRIATTRDDDNSPPPNFTLILLLTAFIGAASWLCYEVNTSLRTSKPSVTNGSTSTAAPTVPAEKRTVSDDILALKRLLREVFEKLLKLDERISELEPKPDDLGVVVPALEGPKIVHVIRRPGDGAAELAQIQIHGRLQWGTFKPFVEGAAAASGASELLQQVAGPVLRLIAHSLLAEEYTCLVATATVTQRGIATIDKVLLKTKLPGKARLLCSFLGGGIENVAPRLNPFTGYGVTDTLRKGHGLEFIHGGGTGTAAAVSLGPLALAGGVFIEGGPTFSSHSVAQATVRKEGLASCHFLVARHESWLIPPALTSAADSGETAAAESATASGSMSALFLPRQGRGRTRTLEDGRKVDGGIAGTVHLGEGLVLSGWSRWDMSHALHDSWGVGLCTQPDEGGHMMGLAVSRNTRQTGGAWMGELSAKIHTADGFTTAPSALLYQIGNQKVFVVGSQAEWRF